MARVILADDHPLFRQALEAALTAARPDLAVEQAASLAELLQRLDDRRPTDLVLLDLKMPDSDGFAGLVAIRAQYPHVPVVVVSGLEDARTIEAAMGFGAAAFIPKSVRAEQLSEALGAVFAGDTWRPAGAPVASPQAGAVEAIASLSAAQLRTLIGLKKGLLNKQIAHELNVTEATVKAHMTALFRKLGVLNRTQALIVAQAMDVA